MEEKAKIAVPGSRPPLRLLLRDRCLWSTGSTNKDTMQPELPQRCKEKGCDGFIGTIPECEMAMK